MKKDFKSIQEAQNVKKKKKKKKIRKHLGKTPRFQLQAVIDMIKPLTVTENKGRNLTGEDDERSSLLYLQV